MTRRDIIVIATSTGGVDALARLVRALPPSFPASLFVVCHFPAGAKSMLPEILSRSGPLLAVHATDGETFYPGQIYVAPPDRHMVLDPASRLRLTRGPRENHHRPAADPLFRTAARHYGRRVVGVVLTGAMYDGAAGLIAVRASGGLAVVQDPVDALSAAMPLNAVQIAGANYVVPIAELGPTLVDIVRHAAPDGVSAARADPIEAMPDVVSEDMRAQIEGRRRGVLSVFTCPECGGALWQVDEAAIVRFRCQVGHSYNGETLLANQSEALEAALWTAVRTFREKTLLARQLARRDRAKGNEAAAERFEEQAAQAERFAALILRHVLGEKPAQAGEPDVPPGEATTP